MRKPRFRISRVRSQIWSHAPLKPGFFLLSPSLEAAAALTESGGLGVSATQRALAGGGWLSAQLRFLLWSSARVESVKLRLSPVGLLEAAGGKRNPTGAGEW